MPLVGVVGDDPLDVGPGGDALGEDVLLLGVVVAAAADDEQGPDRLVFRPDMPAIPSKATAAQRYFTGFMAGTPGS